jgi:hypothetical protein
VRVQGGLILRSITDETPAFGERDVRGRHAVSLVVCDDLDPIVLPHADTGVARSKINSNGLGHGDGCCL